MFNSHVSLAIDRAVLGLERTRGLVRWLWCVRLAWLTRKIM